MIFNYYARRNYYVLNFWEHLANNGAKKKKIRQIKRKFPCNYYLHHYFHERVIADSHVIRVISGIAPNGIQIVNLY